MTFVSFFLVLLSTWTNLIPGRAQLVIESIFIRRDHSLPLFSRPSAFLDIDMFSSTLTLMPLCVWVAAFPSLLTFSV